MSAGLHRRPTAPDAQGRVHHIPPEAAGWEFTGFDLHRLAPGQSAGGTNEGVETCAVVVSGAAVFEVAGATLAQTTLRPSPFDRQPWALYAPLGASWRVTARASLELAVCSAPARAPRPPLVVRPEDVVVETRGTGTNTRHVLDILPAGRNCADRLLVLEALTPAGHWSSYPPHKHDEEALPEESRLEEVYYHRLSPSQGFAFQRVYTHDRSLDDTMTVADGEVVLVPRGYHPVAAAHGYDLWYLNVMAGPERVWRPRVDPDHAWLVSQNGA